MILPGAARWKMAGCLACLLIATALSVSALAVQAEAEPIRVSTARMLQEAIEDAPEGAVIQLEPGVYAGRVEITKSLTLRGDPEDPLGTALHAGLLVSGNAETEVSLEGFTIDGSWPGGCLVIQEEANVTCETMVIRDAPFCGLGHEGTGRVRLISCHFQDNKGAGLRVERPEAVCEGTGNTFEGNGVPLAGYANPDLRIPLSPETSSMRIRVPTDYATLQEAVDAAPPGATIELDEGTFDAGVVFWKPFTLVGAGEDGTRIAPTRNTGKWVFSEYLSILACVEDARIENLTLAGGMGKGLEIHGHRIVMDSVTLSYDVHSSLPFVRALGTADVVLTQCQATGAHISAEASSHVRIQDSTFQAANGYAVSAIETARLDIRNTAITGCSQTAVLGAGDSSILLDDCDIAKNEEGGVAISDHASLHVTDSRIDGNGYMAIPRWDGIGMIGCGLEMASTATAILENVSFGSNAGAGILCYNRDMESTEEMGRLEVSGCEIRGNGHTGITASSLPTLVMDRSQVTGNAGNGITLLGIESSRIHECEIGRNTEEGLSWIGPGSLFLEAATIDANRILGVKLGTAGTSSLLNCRIARHPTGILLASNVDIDMRGCTIEQSELAAIATDSLACVTTAEYASDLRFTGRLTGSGNWIPGPDEPAGNAAVTCPESWAGMVPSGFFLDAEPSE